MISTSVISWLIHEGRLHRDPSELTAAFSKQCVTAGIPLSRVRVVLLVLPPQDLSYLLTWLRGQGIDETRIPPDEYPELLRASPLLPLANGESEVRHHLCDEPSFEIEVLNTLKAEGHTDYVAQLLPAADRTRSRAMVYVTDHEGGFTDEHLDALRLGEPGMAQDREQFKKENRRLKQGSQCV